MIHVVFTSVFKKETRELLRNRLKGIANTVFYDARSEQIPAEDLLKASIVVGWVPETKILKQAVNCMLFQTPAVGIGQKRLEFFIQNPEMKRSASQWLPQISEILFPSTLSGYELDSWCS